MKLNKVNNFRLMSQVSFSYRTCRKDEVLQQIFWSFLSAAAASIIIN